MNQSDLRMINISVAEMEDHYGKTLPESIRASFLTDVMKSFTTIAAFQRACYLVAVHEVSYGRFPALSRFVELYREDARLLGGAYRVPALDAAEVPPPKERGVVMGGKYNRGDVCRLVAKAKVSAFLRRQVFFVEAIMEAVSKNMTQDEISEIKASFEGAIADLIKKAGSGHGVEQIQSFATDCREAAGVVCDRPRLVAL